MTCEQNYCNIKSKPNTYVQCEMSHLYQQIISSLFYDTITQPCFHLQQAAVFSKISPKPTLHYVTSTKIGQSSLLGAKDS